MFNLRKILRKIHSNEINKIDLSCQTLPDYSKQPEIAIIKADERYPTKEIWEWGSMIVLPNNKLATSYEGDIYIWDIDKKTCVNKLTSESYITALSSLNDGRLLSAHGDGTNGTVKMWQSETGQFLGTLLKQNCWVRCMIPFFKGCFVTGGDDGLIRMWDINSGKLILPVLSGHSAGVSDLVETGPLLLASLDCTKNLIEWEIDATEKHTVINMNAMSECIWSLADDWQNNLYFGDHNGFILKSYTEENGHSWSIKPYLKISQSPISLLKALPDENTMLAGTSYGTICFFELEKSLGEGAGMQILKMPDVFDYGTFPEFKNVGVLPDGRCLIGVSGARIILLTFPQRALTAEDIKDILKELKINNSVSSIDLSNVRIIDEYITPLLGDLIKTRKDINIIGVSNLDKCI